jgi:hypothetical protein
VSFRQWVRQHVGQSVRVEWERFGSRSSGGARVMLIGFDEGAEEHHSGGVLLALLEELNGTNRAGLNHIGGGTVPIVTLAPQVERLLAEGPDGTIVWLAVEYLKRVEAVNNDVVVCSVDDRFQVDYDDPTHAAHGDLACPLHDEPRWRSGETSVTPWRRPS